MDTSIVALQKFYKKHKRLPSYSEMAKLFGYSSKGGVTYAVGKLIAGGYLARDHKKIIPGYKWNDSNKLKVLGLVEAGFPTIAEEDLSNTLSLDEFLIDNKEATYMLTVKGDSMIDAGILAGDLVLMERTEKARPNDIVIAEVDGGYTLKYLRKKGAAYYLEPANKKYKNIYPEESLNIQGVLKAVIRKY
jgi:SOS regulatory protein LexA